MPKIALIGAGSAVFTRNLAGDILGIPELAGDATIALMDIDAGRLETSEIVVRRLVDAHRARARVEATLDRRAALDGADYVVTSFQVGGFTRRPSSTSRCPSATACARRSRTRSGWAGSCAACAPSRCCSTCAPRWSGCALARCCCSTSTRWRCSAAPSPRPRPSEPSAYVTPSSTPRRSSRAISASLRRRSTTSRGDQPHGVLPSLRARRRGPLPGPRELAASGRVREDDRVRYEVLRHFGYFVTESSEHFAEYVPWFIKRERPDLVERFGIPLDKYLERSERQIAEWDALRARLQAGDAIEVARSHEYGADILRACEGGEPFVFNGNVPNTFDGRRLIDNLPADCCVEVPCVASVDGIEPLPVGALPRHLAALMQTNVNVQGLTVEAALTGSRDAPRRAAMLDPHTAAELSLDEIARLVGELFEAHGEWIPRRSDVDLGRPCSCRE